MLYTLYILYIDIVVKLSSHVPSRHREEVEVQLYPYSSPALGAIVTSVPCPPAVLPPKRRQVVQKLEWP